MSSDEIASVMRQALEALERYEYAEARVALRQAIAVAEQHEKQTSVSEVEPVALMVVNGEISYKSTDDDQSFGMWCPVNYDSSHSFPDGTKFYTHLPVPQGHEPKRNVATPREWVGLTAEEREQVQSESYGKVPHHVALIAAVEAKLKAKNFA